MSPRAEIDPGLDARWHATIGQLTGGLSPAALATAYVDWALHLAGSLEKQAELVQLAMAGINGSDPEDDRRFRDPSWRRPPFATLAESFLAVQGWWNAATTGVPGVDPRHAEIVNFAARQWLDMMSPSNFALTNPQVHGRSREELGRNLLRGARYWIEDFNRLLTGKRRRPASFAVGRDMALTPGDVIFRNRLIELIRYRPTTPTVRPEPILIVPAWIMKYYILDLMPGRSLVAYLRDQGFEVFVISWKNPDRSDAGLAMQDYLDLGLRAAVDAVASLGRKRIHAVGYCLGGTLLAIAAAAMARDGDRRLKTASFLASQVDFSDPGGLGLFINESQVAFLEDIMSTRGFLEADQMAGAFQLLRSNDLIWSRVIRHYLLGERTPGNALMAWNSDATRMPARMHAEYLRRLFLENDLAKGRFEVDGASVALTDIRCPVYCVGTESDHVSPWRSVYRMVPLTDTDVTFVLTNGGHNGGILSEPGHDGRHFRASKKTEGELHISAEDWLARHKPTKGSWWTHWVSWLANHSAAAKAAAGQADVPRIDPAPGKYVFG